ncbi:MAG: hypothetical protein K2Y28_07785 [Burkholderiaceae bacterium]|nr:hypothetical protein [Burkholderiaceae bacterium]
MSSLTPFLTAGQSVSGRALSTQINKLAFQRNSNGGNESVVGHTSNSCLHHLSEKGVAATVDATTFVRDSVVAPRVDHIHYEQLKRQWSYENPNATPAQFELAMRGIAKLCGV